MTDLSRRELFLTGSAMAAGLVMLADSSASAQNPATQVEDRTTTCTLTPFRPSPEATNPT